MVKAKYFQLFVFPLAERADEKSALSAVERRYNEALRLKENEIAAYRQQVSKLMNIAELLASKSMTSEINQTFNAPVGNAAAENFGTMSAIQNMYGSKAEDIVRLLTGLREQAQSFPNQYQEDALDTINDLSTDLEKGNVESSKIGRRLKRLFVLASAVGAISGGVATFSGRP